jgi:thiamine biosynthesis protein ThiI
MDGSFATAVSGQVVTLLSSGFDSPVATWMCMRRGAVAVAVHFHSYPYTSDASIQNVRSIVRVLARGQGTMLLYAIPIIDFQRAVMIGAPHALRVLLYRRMMVRLAELVAREVGAGALVTGENLGQVASQTLPNIAAIDAVATIPILRPLIGFDKMEIIARAEAIGTAEISRRPYDDCCSLFTPAHPATAANAQALDRIDDALAWKDWTQKLFDQRTHEMIVA